MEESTVQYAVPESVAVQLEKLAAARGVQVEELVLSIIQEKL